MPEGAGVGHDDMHASRAHALHALNGASDLSFESTHTGYLLHERGEADGPHLVEQLIAGVGAARQAFLRQQHARSRRLSRVHEDRRALRIDVEGNARFLQGGADTRHILRLKAGVERLVFRPAQIVADEADGDEDRHTHQAEHGQTPCAEGQQVAP